MKILRQIVFSLITGGGIAFLFIASTWALAAWVPPSAAPPGGNITPPLNIGPDAQTKSGNLTVEGNVTVESDLTVHNIASTAFLTADIIDGTVSVNTPGRFFASNLSGTKMLELGFIDGANNRAIVYSHDSTSGNNVLLPLELLGSDIRFWTGADMDTRTEKMRILQDGKVGIGLSNPANKLSVAGVIESTTGGIKFPDGTTQITAAAGGGGGVANGTSTNQTLYWNGTAWAVNNFLSSDGTNVSVGNLFPDPLVKLKIYNFSGDRFLMFSRDTGVASTKKFYYFDVGTNGTLTLKEKLGETGSENSVLNIINGGNVGIGVSSPQTKLDIAGELRASGAFRMGNGIATSGVPLVPSPNFYIQSAFWNGASSQSRVWSLRAETSSLADSTLYFNNPVNTDAMTLRQNGTLTVTGDVCTSTACLNSVGGGGGGGWASDANGIHNITGGVGIGGDSWAGIPLRIHANTTSSNLINFERSGTTIQYKLLMDDAAVGGNLSLLAYNGTWGRALDITPTGRVGIGGLSPVGAKLQVFDVADELFKLDRGLGNYYMFAVGTDGALAVKKNPVVLGGPERMYLKIDTDGSVYMPTLISSPGIGCNTIDTDSNGKLTCGVDEGGGGGGAGAPLDAPYLVFGGDHAALTGERWLGAGSNINLSAVGAVGTGSYRIDSTHGVISSKGLLMDVTGKFGLQNCGTDEILKYNASGQWVCAADNGGGGGGGTVNSVGAGIGLTASPVNPFTVSGTISIDQTWLNSWGDLRYLTQASGDTRYINASGDTMTGSLTISAGGLTVGAGDLLVSIGGVGIGGAPGTYKLNVVGTANISSDLRVGGNTTFVGRADIGWERRSNATAAGNPGCSTFELCTVSCSAGKKVIGGGCIINNTDSELNGNFPVNDTTWQCEATGEAGGIMTAYAICANVGP